jgi:hypothetical protein
MLKFLKSLFGSKSQTRLIQPKESVSLEPSCPLQKGDKITLNLRHDIYSFKIGEVYTAESFYIGVDKKTWFVRVKEIGGSTFCSDFDKVYLKMV